MALDGNILYRDDNHLNLNGTRYVAQKFLEDATRESQRLRPLNAWISEVHGPPLILRYKLEEVE
jgi:hypothetical protein